MMRRRSLDPPTAAQHREFGVSVRYFRLKLNLSQEDLAIKCGLDRTYIGGIERGERNPSLKNILVIAKALEVAPSSLFEVLAHGQPKGRSS
jgi:transcriptional regulator with XRE-family HTH domain